LDILYGKGFSKAGDLLDLAVIKGIVEKSGSWYSYKSDRLGQGRDTVVGILETQPAIFTTLDKAVRATL
jgi:recombination protein RecA